jgi:rod shape determining protein RodA
MTMGLMPVTGIPLPFISYGRSNLVVSVISLGLLQGIAMSSKKDS